MRNQLIQSFWAYQRCRRKSRVAARSRQFISHAVVRQTSVGASLMGHKGAEKIIQHKYKRGEFAETESLGIVGGIIKKCWQGEYEESARRSVLTSSSYSTRPAESTSVYTVLAVATIAVVIASALVKLGLSRTRQAL
ncbi:hypothetical protein B0T19DRAFT_437656 [Cercophora scortea]|uniref:Uncharacterized protein n=1 Tax=Cercophora scortea TaxID=314031 RepID=A0AAE0J4T4_9PEZI|nr:hypothetical protein B0T19DRAFT_437656 [Cercophora scortea]